MICTLWYRSQYTYDYNYNILLITFLCIHMYSSMISQMDYDILQ